MWATIGDPSGDKSVDQNGNEIKPLSLAARSILNVLAQYPDGRTKSQISILSGYSRKSSSFSNALSQLRTLGLISPAGINPIIITRFGLAEAGEVDPVPKGNALIRYWLNKLSKAEGAILSAAIDAYPLEVSYDTIASYTGYSRTSSSFSNALSKLRALDLISGYGNVKASNIFFEEE